MTRTRTAALAGGAAVVLALSGAGIAVAAGGPNGGGNGYTNGYAVGGNGPTSDRVGGMGNGMGMGRYAAQNGTGPGSGTCLSIDATVPVGTLTEEQIATLLHMREEEQLAHDLYVEFADAWGDARFTRIAESESRHIDAVQTLLDRYGLEDPSPGAGFADEGLQQLWDDLLAQGLESHEAALEVGRIVERTDIADLTEAINQGQPTDVENVYEHLLAGSERHLAAFGG